LGIKIVRIANVLVYKKNLKDWSKGKYGITDFKMLKYRNNVGTS
jgi:hypothetical protein